MSDARRLRRMGMIDNWSLFGRKIETLRLRARAYRLTFKSMHGQQALMDLAQFCHANESCFHMDPRAHAALEGRREVWLRIQNHLNLTPEELLAIYDRRGFPAQPQPEESENV